MSDLKLLNAMVNDMAWRGARNKVIAQNIANADTPGYQAQDLAPRNFKDLLAITTSRPTLRSAAEGVAKTHDGHMDVGGTTLAKTVRERPARDPYEVAPAGNSVILEEQLLKASENHTGYTFTANLYEKYTNMIKAALKAPQ